MKYGQGQSFVSRFVMLLILFGGMPAAWGQTSAPADKDGNRIQTVLGKGFFLILRLYGPLEPWFDKTGRSGELKLVK
jgi:hypothetical protein